MGCKSSCWQVHDLVAMNTFTVCAGTTSLVPNHGHSLCVQTHTHTLPLEHLPLSVPCLYRLPHIRSPRQMQFLPGVESSKQPGC